MLKAIYADEVQVGDVVIPERGAPEMGVMNVRVHADGGCEIVVVNPKTLEISMRTCSRNAILGLVRRPWSEGKTERDMLDAILALASSCPGRVWSTMSEWEQELLEKRLVRLREAIEAYERGKQPAVDAKHQEDDDVCRVGRCKHPKNFAGSCLSYLACNPPQRDC